MKCGGTYKFKRNMWVVIFILAIMLTGIKCEAQRVHTSLFTRVSELERICK